MKQYIYRILNSPPQAWGLALQRKILRLRPISAFDDHYPIIFVLSTGRVGTQTLAALLRLNKNLLVFHEPTPILYGLSQHAYWHEDHPIAHSVLNEAVYCARSELWQQALLSRYGYVETSPQLTFLAPILLELHPRARFIHLVRHPYAVVRSGIRRGWYLNHPSDRTRLTPKTDDSVSDIWDELPQLEKIAWLWTETNRWIMTFMETVSFRQKLLIRSESLFAAEESTLEELYRFANGAPPPPKKIHRILGRKLNAQRTGHFPPPHDWDDAMRKDVGHWVGDVAKSLGYSP